MAKPKKSVWVVVICEMTESGVPIATIRRVTSSLRLAEAEVKSGYTAPFSWYEVEERFVDDTDSDPRAVRVYSHKCRRLKNAPKKLASFYLKRFLKSSYFKRG